MKNYNLRPCPFCGGNAIFKVINTVASASRSGMTFNVQCAECRTSAPTGHIPEISLKLYEDGSLEIIKDEREYAAQWWNGTIHEVGGKS